MISFKEFLKIFIFILFVLSGAYLVTTAIPTMLNSSNIVFVWLAFAAPVSFVALCLYFTYLFLKR